MTPNKNYMVKETGEMLTKFEAMRYIKWMEVGKTITLVKVYDD